MTHRTSSLDFADPDWPLQPISSYGSTASLYQDSEATGLLSGFPTPPTPRTPAGSPEISPLNRHSVANVDTLVIQHSVTVGPPGRSFTKGGQLFKLKFTQIDICKDPAGNLRCLELRDTSGQANFIHTFPGTRLPIPHIEKPISSSQERTFVASFLEEQTVQTAGTLFTAKPHYTFEDKEDCMRFQEKVLDQKLVFMAGVAEVKSKGRGEECISQNLRILRAKSGRQVILLFANSQRKEKKRYISIPLDCIDQINQDRKAGRPIFLRLRPNLELLAQLKSLQIQFLDDHDQRLFYGILNQGVGATPL